MLSNESSGAGTEARAGRRVAGGLGRVDSEGLPGSRFDTSSYHYQSRRIDPAFLKKRIKEICETHVRYGYRRVYCILRRDGWAVNMKKVYRLYRELGL